MLTSHCWYDMLHVNCIIRFLLMTVQTPTEIPASLQLSFRCTTFCTYLTFLLFCDAAGCLLHRSSSTSLKSVVPLRCLRLWYHLFFVLSVAFLAFQWQFFLTTPEFIVRQLLEAVSFFAVKLLIILLFFGTHDTHTHTHA